MKYFNFIILTAVICIIIIPCGYCQNSQYGFDTIHILKQKRNRNIYQFIDSGSLEIQYSISDPKHLGGRMGLGNAGNGFLTILTGINFATSKDLTFKVEGTIKCNEALPDWELNLFCEGHGEKDRERVKNEDGSWSVVTETNGSLYWDRNATGIILENRDTIGSFLIITDPWTNPLLKNWAPAIENVAPAEVKTASTNKYYIRYLSYTDISYGIIGVFRDREFVLISNGSARKSWLYTDNDLRCIFSPDNDDTNVNNKDRTEPFLLMNGYLPGPQRRDFFRISIMSRFLSRALKL